MLNRRRVILTLLASANAPISRTRLVKLMFLLKQETDMQEDRTFYDFLPYKYGPFSFTLYRELDILHSKGFIDFGKNEINLLEVMRVDSQEEVNRIPLDLRQEIRKIYKQYKAFTQSELLNNVYKKYPDFAIRSEIDGKANTEAKTKPAQILYTLGYEGKSADYFFDTLIRKEIKQIIDVRANPISRKYGFSKKALTRISNKLDINYIHRPEVGIPKEYRTELDTYESYQRLLNKYETELMPTVVDDIFEIGGLVKNATSTMLCMEDDYNCCHRSRLAKAVGSNTGLMVRHI